MAPLVAVASVLAGGLAAASPAAAAVTAPATSSPPAAGVQNVPATSADGALLAETYASARHLPGSAVAGVRPGTLRLARVASTGVTWAVAGFMPAASAGADTRIAFQDGAATGVFSQAPGQGWRLVQASGPASGCDQGLPPAVRAAWHLAVPAGCGTPLAEQEKDASSALARNAQPGAGGSLSQAIARIALSQVGVGANPPIQSFSGVDCDPYSTMVAAQSPNSDGCGYDARFRVQDQNEEWCSDFAKWVWQRAGVTADMNTINAGADSFDAWAQDQGEATPVDPASPRVGDAVVFYPAGPVSPTAYADHVGLITAVNSDGTINMVNGDFLGASNSAVEYDTDINLATWAPATWNDAGEQWIFVAPPSSAQAPVPHASVSGPQLAVAGTAANFTARASQPGGSISQYLWTFGDGRNGNTTGTAVSHVYPNPGLYTATMTATSNAGTVTTRTWNVDVVAESSTVTSTPSDAVWYSTTPVYQDLYRRTSSGGLAEDGWDGASWLDKSLPGTLSAGGGLTALNYADASGALQPHVYYRSAAGQLAQSYVSGGAWTTQTLAGDPAAGSDVVAATAPAAPQTTAAAVTPEVFFIDTTGRPAESYLRDGAWATRTLPGPAAGHDQLAVAETVQGTRACAELYYLDGRGDVTATSPDGCGPDGALVVPARLVSASSPLSAVSTGPGGRQQDVFFTARDGHLAEAARGTGPLAALLGRWQVRDLPGTPSGALAAVRTLPGSALSSQPSAEVFYLTAGGQPASTYLDGQTWRNIALPGTATSILGAAAYPSYAGSSQYPAYPGSSQPERLFLGGPGGVTADTADVPAGPWTASTLPDTPATFADTVVLYAATPADYQSALAAAGSAGLPASQVTQSFATAWADTLSGDHLVITVGLAATDALYYNVCGWPNPSGEIPESTPFYIDTAAPLNHLPPAGAFENGAAKTAAQSPQRAADLAYYAVHGTLPPGVSALPTAASTVFACSGQPS